MEWGILGSGGAASSFAHALARSETGTLRTVGSRTPSSAKSLAASQGRHVDWSGLADVLVDSRINAIYVGLVNTAHADWVVRAAEAGKHILCEKPLGVDAAQARRMVDAAEAAGVILMEAMTYRSHPQTRQLAAMVQERRIGTLLQIEATLGYEASGEPHGRHFSPSLGGGAILDIGCYATSMIRMLAGAAQGVGVIEPDTVAGAARIGRTGVDESAVGTFRFPGGLLATASVSISMRQPGRLRLYGSEGSITVPDPWRPEGTNTLIVTRHREGTTERVPVAGTATAREHEIHEFTAAVRGRKPGALGMRGDDCVGNARVLDHWRASARVDRVPSARRSGVREG
nr:Gfo/Idh/MocA family oxidoreductase [Streptomyces sp. TP-A0356]